MISNEKSLREGRGALAVEVLRDPSLLAAVTTASRLYIKAMKQADDISLSPKEIESTPQSEYEGKLIRLNRFLESGLVENLLVLHEAKKVNPHNGTQDTSVNFGGRLEVGKPASQVYFSVRTVDQSIREEAILSKSLKGASPAQIFHGQSPDSSPVGSESDFKVNIGLKELVLTEDHETMVTDYSGVCLAVKGNEVIGMQGVTKKMGQYHYTDDLLNGHEDLQMKLPQETIESITSFSK